MLNYIYDGSFEGLLTAIYQSFILTEKPDNILAESDSQVSFFDTNIKITTDPQKSDNMLNQVREKISWEALYCVICTFLSELYEAGTLIFNYLDLGFQIGNNVNFFLSDDRVLKIHNISKKVAYERHRMLGLIRFKQLKGGIYYAPIEPDHNITCLLVSHFVKRMPKETWIIHDVKRNLSALYKDGRYDIRFFVMSEEPSLDDREIVYQSLWREYFDSIAIKSKINPRLQKSHMPVRYWKYLIEKSPR